MNFYKMNGQKQLVFIGLILLSICTSRVYAQSVVSTTEELQTAAAKLQPGDVLSLSDGVYKDFNLVVKASGAADKPIIIKAKNPGQVFFSGDVAVELRGDYLTLEGIYFKNGNRNSEEWNTHGPGLVAIYGSYNRITQCAFHAFDQANSAYITTSVDENGKVPQYCRIDHCSFTEKITFDQVINLNNRLLQDINKAKKLGENAPSATPMYHRIDHCYFANPRKPGNAGGGIRVGYWRSDLGRCLIDSNLFERQDSEPEIITSKSMENLYYNNTYKNCQGTMNFRHGDKQVAINNFHIGSDQMYEYGGMFVWGSDHIIANNYFNLPTTLSSRGNAALYLNCGPVASEFALAYNTQILNNLFADNNGYAIDFSALYDRRKEWSAEQGLILEVPKDLYLTGNVFISSNQTKYPLFHRDEGIGEMKGFHWDNNIMTAGKPGLTIESGFETKKVKSEDPFEVYNRLATFKATKKDKLYNIEGINMDIPALVEAGLQGSPSTWEEVGPDWLEEIPGTYAATGRLSPDIQKQFDAVTVKRKK